MTTYIDTGVLLKAYVLEPDSPAAIKLLELAGVTLAYSHLHELELPNALQLKCFRGELTSRQLARALALIDSDRAEGRLTRPTYSLEQVFSRATSLAAHRSAKCGARSLDLLHVAIALESDCTTFISLDRRQRLVAAAEGLSVKPTRVPAR